MSSGFISETTIEEARKKRQEEWERVRKPEEPKDAPEEPYDSRSLFERLEENKRLKQEAWDAEHDIKNVVRGIDDDEAAFLDKVDEVKTSIESKRILEERLELEEYKKMKEKLFEEEEEKRLKTELEVKKLAESSKKALAVPKKKQASLLVGAVVKKRANSETEKNESIPAVQAKKAKPAMGALLGLSNYSSSSEEED